MTKGYARIDRVADLIQATLAEILKKNAQDERFALVTITDVKVSPDFAIARIYISVLDDQHAKETVAALNKAAKFLRYNLAHEIDLRVTPALKFFYDDTAARGDRISSLINAALKKAKEE